MSTEHYDAEAAKRLLNAYANPDWGGHDKGSLEPELASALRAAQEYIEGLEKAVNRALELNKRPINDMALNEQQRILSEVLADSAGKEKT